MFRDLGFGEFRKSHTLLGAFCDWDGFRDAAFLRDLWGLA